MADKVFIAGNYAMVTTAAPSALTLTASTIQTLMQIKCGATTSIRLVQWWFSCNGSAAATPGIIELIWTSTIGASVTTAFASTAVQLYNDCNRANIASSVVTGGSNGTATSGFTGNGTEGSITSTVSFDTQQLAPTGQYLLQDVLGYEPEVAPSTFVRIRATYPAGVGVLCGMMWKE